MGKALGPVSAFISQKALLKFFGFVFFKCGIAKIGTHEN